MRSFLCCCLLIASFAPTRGQSPDHFVLTGKRVTVLDAVTLRPIPYARIASWQPTNLFSKEKHFEFFTDEKGVFLLNDWWTDSDQFTFTAFGYESQVFKLKALREQGYLVQMRREWHRLVSFQSPVRFRHTAPAESPREAVALQPVDMENHLAATVPELVRQSGVAFIQKSDQAGGSPMVGAWESNRVAVTLNGVRLNHGLLGTGHSHILSQVDVNNLQALDAAPGSAGLLYGSDAIGGVIAVREQWASALGGKSAPRFTAFARTSTASQEGTVHLSMDLHGSKVALRTALTSTDLNDLRSGSQRPNAYPLLGQRPYFQLYNAATSDEAIRNGNPERQVLSGARTLNLHQSLAAEGKYISHTLFFNSYVNGRTERYDQLTRYALPDTSALLYGNSWRSSNWLMAGYRGMMNRKNRFFDNATILLAWQRNRQSQSERQFDRLFRTEETTVVNSFNASFILNRSLKGGRSNWRQEEQKLSYGAEFSLDKIKGRRDSLLQLLVMPMMGPVPNEGSSVLQAGGFVRWSRPHKNWLIHAGIRLNHTRVMAAWSPQADFTYLPASLSISTSQLAWDWGFRRMLARHLFLRFNQSSGFRGPNVNDLRTQDPGLGSEFLLMPNDRLRSEFSLSHQLGIHGEVEEVIDYSITAFSTHLKNGIAIGDTPFGSYQHNQDSLTLMQLENRLNGWVRGLTGQWLLAPSKSFSLYGRFTLAKGTESGTGAPLPQVAPLYGRVGIQFSRKRLMTDVWVWMNGRKRSAQYAPDYEENLFFATADGVPAYVTVNANVRLAITRNFSLQLGIENALNQQVRTYASAISEAGRNFQFQLRARF